MKPGIIDFRNFIHDQFKIVIGSDQILEISGERKL